MRGCAFAVEQAGLRLVSGGTDVGLMLVDLRAKGVSGEAASKALERAGLACNKNMIPFDPEPPEVASGLRLSSNAGTTRGFGTQEFRQVGHWIGEVIDGLAAGRPVEAETREAVRAMCGRFPIYPGLYEEVS